MKRRELLQTLAVAPLGVGQSESLAPEHFGAVGDGVSDDTAALQKAVDEAIGKKLILSRVYRLTVAGLVIPSNSHIVFSEGARLELLPHSVKSYQIMRIHDVGNVLIENAHVDGRRDLNAVTGGEWGMGISICGSTDKVRLIDPVTDNCWGDGIYIGSTRKQGYCEDVYIRNHRADSNRRQGMSVISVKRLVVDDPVWANTGGTSPQAGLDIEPNEKNDRLDYIRINNPKTSNCAGNGILIVLSSLVGAAGKNIDIVITGHQNDRSSAAMECYYYDPGTSDLTGLIQINSTTSRNSKFNGMVFRDWGLGPLRIEVLNPVIIDNNKSGSKSAITSAPFIIYRAAASQLNYLMGGIVIENAVVQTPNTTVGNSFVVNDYKARTMSIRDVTIRNIKQMPSNAPMFMPAAMVSIENSEGNTGSAGALPPDTDLSYNAYSPLFRHLGAVRNVTTLPSGAVGQPSFTVENGGSGGVRVMPPKRGHFVDQSPDKGYDSAAAPGQKIKMTPLGDGVWRVDTVVGAWKIQP